MSTKAAAGSDVTLMDAASMADDIDGDYVDVSGFSAFSFALSWTGDGVGPVYIKQSNDAVQWDIMDDVVISPPAGADGRSSCNMTPPGGRFPMTYLKPFFDHTSGSGPLTIKGHGVDK